jgi:3alpha(or 20beta)-hydroxysteroid dehydrogenase
MDRLRGKVILISGGARGQGAAEARLFVAEGARLSLAMCSSQRATRLHPSLVMPQRSSVKM